MAIKLVVFDADKTLWSHPNVSNLTLPFKLVDRNTVSDAEGVTFHLYEGIRELLSKLQRMGVTMTVASWNKPEPVKQALNLFSISCFFKIVKAEFHENKHLMIASTLSELSEDGVKLKSEEILYVDDRTLHIENVRNKVGAVHFIQMWVDAKSPNDILQYVEKTRR